MTLTTTLRSAYGRLFDSCEIREPGLVEAVARRLHAAGARYGLVQGATGVPWYVVAVIHQLESAQSWTRHLHNGDPLTARTRNVPAGRPPEGTPPFTWEHSAADALTMRGHRLDQWTDWTIPGVLYVLERYNGWGYRRYHPEVKSPYLWAGSQHYARGKYVSDGTWSATAVSRQIGAAVILRRMLELGLVGGGSGTPKTLISYWTRGAEIPHARDLQRWLNTIPGVTVLVDGRPGQRTSDGVKRVLGHYLEGDPRR